MYIIKMNELFSCGTLCYIYTSLIHDVFLVSTGATFSLPGVVDLDSDVRGIQGSLLEPQIPEFSLQVRPGGDGYHDLHLRSNTR